MLQFKYDKFIKNKMNLENIVLNKYYLVNIKFIL